MNLRTRWTRRLNAAQETAEASEFAWHARVEARVLRFLLARYAGAMPAAPLAGLPFFEGEAPHGRARALLCAAQQRARLQHIAQAQSQPRITPLSPTGFDLQQWLENAAWSHSQHFQNREKRRLRRQARHERGYW